MPLQPGDKLGPYEILAPIGKGGMGEVYRAHDSRLNRDVAIKVSNAQFTERFARESRAIAALNHTNICHLYDVGPDYLVMEYVEGENLQGPIDLKDALPLIQQLIDGIEAAHEKNIIHRDLKPANIKITPEGIVKILDFGLAKATEPPPFDDGKAENSPTLTMSATAAGTILGTAAYMAPEQAKGKTADRRTDIWSFGVIVYEMLTGQRLFQGDSAMEVLSAVMHGDPDISAAPTRVHKLLRWCLEKDRKKRLQAIGDAWRVIEESESARPTPPGSSRARFVWAACAVAAAAIMLAASIGYLHFHETAPDQRVLRFSVPPPSNGSIGFLAVSPDGRRLVVNIFSDSKGQLWLRSLDSQQFQRLSGTDGARSPFWSADSRYIGFFADGRLKTIPAAGGPTQTLCGETGLGTGGAWNRDGVILFGSERGPLRRVSAKGGECKPVTKSDQASRDSFPEFLPDSKHFLYFHGTNTEESLRGVYVAALDDPSGRKILSDNSNALFAPKTVGQRNSHLLFFREGNLMAQAFDAGALQTVGDPFLVADQASPTFTPPGVAASLSSNGTLVYLADRSVEAQLTWFDRSGKELGKAGPRAEFVGVSLSPDGNTVAVGRWNESLWLYDVVRSSEARFTASGTAAVWSPDNSRLVWWSPQSQGLIMGLASRAGLQESLLKTPDPRPASDWSRDGRFLVYTQVESGANVDIWYLPDPGNGEKKPVKFLATDALESQGQLSPDGRWIAYVSNEAGQLEVYVRPFPSGLGQWRVSANGGAEPRWRNDGKELFFLEPGTSKTLLAVSVQPEGRGGLKLGTPQKLFAFKGLQIVPQSNLFLYSPHPDGKRFLVAVSANATEPAINIVTNWQAALKK